MTNHVKIGWNAGHDVADSWRDGLVNCPADRGNLEFMLPDRREANFAGGKSPEQFNYISVRGTAILEKRLRALMWAELHELMDENKHLHGIEFKETVFTFLKKYDISSIQEDRLLKNYPAAAG